MHHTWKFECLCGLKFPSPMAVTGSYNHQLYIENHPKPSKITWHLRLFCEWIWIIDRYRSVLPYIYIYICIYILYIIYSLYIGGSLYILICNTHHINIQRQLSKPKERLRLRGHQLGGWLDVACEVGHPGWLSLGLGLQDWSGGSSATKIWW